MRRPTTPQAVLLQAARDTEGYGAMSETAALYREALRTAREVLHDHETANSVEFRALDNVALDAVSEARDRLLRLGAIARPTQDDLDAGRQAALDLAQHTATLLGWST